MLINSYVVCALLNGEIADGLEWPTTTPNHHNFYILHCLSYLCSR